MTSADDAQICLTSTQRLTVLESTADKLLLESRWEPGGAPPPRHWHPRQDELFEVLEGELTVERGTETRVLQVGDAVAVPRRTTHRMWNASGAAVRATWRVTPALRTEELLRFIAGGTSPDRVARMLVTFRNEYRIALRR